VEWTLRPNLNDLIHILTASINYILELTMGMHMNCVTTPQAGPMGFFRTFQIIPRSNWHPMFTVFNNMNVVADTTKNVSAALLVGLRSTITYESKELSSP